MAHFFIIIIVLEFVSASKSESHIIASSVFNYKNSIFASPFALNRYCNISTYFLEDLSLALLYKNLSEAIFPKNSKSYTWVKSYQHNLKSQLELYKNNKVLTMLDLFTFPKSLIELYKDQIINNETKLIDIDKPFTLVLLKYMLSELFDTFNLHGIVIRVGEGGGGYLDSFPYHSGNTAIYFGSKSTFLTQQQQYIKLISFLVYEICETRKKILVFRTWDTAGFRSPDPGRFHNNIQYYLNITKVIPYNDLLYFSIKHTTTDFWRYQNYNAIFGKGIHKQIVEVQAAREYEGKGSSYFSYIAHGVIHGFEETKKKYGLFDDMKNNPLLSGIWIWSRGGGWMGPHISDGTVESLLFGNIYVLSKFYQKNLHNFKITEQEIFYEFCSEFLKLNQQSCSLLHEAYLLSSEANLRMHYCEEYDKTLAGIRVPTENWMRDDRLGGLKQLLPVYNYLFDLNKFKEAIYEKEKAINTVTNISNLIHSIPLDQNLDVFTINFLLEHRTASKYFVRLANIIYNGWRAMSVGFIGDKTGSYDLISLNDSIIAYDNSWAAYKSFLVSAYHSGSTYYGKYLGDQPGLDDSIDVYRKLI